MLIAFCSSKSLIYFRVFSRSSSCSDILFLGRLGACTVDEEFEFCKTLPPLTMLSSILSSIAPLFPPRLLLETRLWEAYAMLGSSRIELLLSALGAFLSLLVTKSSWIDSTIEELNYLEPKGLWSLKLWKGLGSFVSPPLLLTGGASPLEISSTMDSLTLEIVLSFSFCLASSDSTISSAISSLDSLCLRLRCFCSGLVFLWASPRVYVLASGFRSSLIGDLTTAGLAGIAA